MMKDGFLFMAALIIVLGAGILRPGNVWAKTSAEATSAGEELMPTLADEQWQKAANEEFQAFMDELNRQIEPYFPPLDWNTLMDGEQRARFFDPIHWLQLTWRLLLDDLLRNSSLLAQMMALAILGLLLQHLHSAFANESVGKLSETVVHMVLLALALASFYVALNTAREVVGDLVDFMLASLPLMISLLVSSGGMVSAGVMSPLLFLLANTVNVVIANWVLPLLFFAALLQIIPSLSSQFRFDRLAQLVRQVAMGLLMAVMGIFVAAISLQGAAGAVADSLGLRTVKYAAKSFVPVVGGMFADASELVFSSSILLRNGLGLVGLMVVILIVFFPIVKLLAMILIYRAGAAVIQPLGADRVVADLSAIAQALTLITVCVGAAGMMAFLVIAILVGIGNIGVMMR